MYKPKNRLIQHLKDVEEEIERVSKNNEKTGRVIKEVATTLLFGKKEEYFRTVISTGGKHKGNYSHTVY